MTYKVDIGSHGLIFLRENPCQSFFAPISYKFPIWVCQVKYFSKTLSPVEERGVGGLSG